jgi:hypothetical protein
LIGFSNLWIHFLQGITSVILLYWFGGVLEAVSSKETAHRAGAKYGIPGQIAWVTAMRILCLIPMGVMTGLAMWGFGGKWQSAVQEDEEATIAYWQDNGLQQP